MKKVEVDPDKAIKLLPLFYAVVFVSAIIFALAVNEHIKSLGNDLFNATALVAEVGFGLAITWTVFVYSKKWKKQNDKAVKDIENLTKNLQTLTKDVQSSVAEEKRIRDEIRFDVSYHLNKKLDTVIKTLTHSLQMYDNYLKNKDGKQEIWKSVMRDSFARAQHYLNMQINLLDLMKIYGADARKYSNLLTNLQVTPTVYIEGSDFEAGEFAGYVKEALKDAKDLKTIIEPLVSESKLQTPVVSQDNIQQDSEQKPENS